MFVANSVFDTRWVLQERNTPTALSCKISERATIWFVASIASNHLLCCLHLLWHQHWARYRHHRERHIFSVLLGNVECAQSLNKVSEPVI
jgi:hypothetical protein